MEKEYKVKSLLSGLIVIVVASSQLQAIKQGTEHFNHDVRLVGRGVATA